jgi:EXPERA (EXPanded EBP superfamily)
MTRRRVDPTRVFVLLCVTIMVIRYLQAGHSLASAISGLFLHPFVLASVGAALATVYCAAVQSRHISTTTTTTIAAPVISASDRAVAEWYFWNACLFHAIMDGGSGSLRLVPVVVHQYDRLDLRFPTHHSVPYIIGLIELLLMAPLCLLCVYSILCRGDPRFQHYRYPLELVTSTLHFTGMVVFVFCEVYEGQCHVPALDPVGQCDGSPLQLKFFNLYHITYYWFGFWFCNGIWGVVPVYRIWRALQECQAALQLRATQTLQKVE